LLDTLDRIANLPYEGIIVFDPPDASGYFQKVADGRFQISPQGDGDLGQRMQRFISGQIEIGRERVALLGTDSPTLPVHYFDQAFQELQKADVVIGPATDGGYYLLGCTRKVPPIFDNIDWGTSEVLNQTIRLLENTSLRMALLPPWYDVDDKEDWSMLCGHIKAMRQAGIDPKVPRTEELARLEMLN
jgi:rSAM/selenodomain-associated transferase 1